MVPQNFAGKVSHFFVTAILVCWSSLACAEEETLTLVSSWNSRQNFTAHFLKYVDSVNKAGKGIVQIKFLGGPSVIPQRQLLYALRRGVIDMAFGGMTYYRGVVPEGDAMFAGTITPMEARANGGFDALQPYWEERINARLVGWMQSGLGPNFYLSDPPTFGPDGILDLPGRIIRTSPTNVELIESVNARPVQIAVKEIYTAFQRGAVEGLVWPIIGFPDLGIDEFVHYRVDPDVLQLAITLQMNLDRWNALSPEARLILTEQAIIYEQVSRMDLFEIRDREVAELDAAGFKSIELEPEVAERWRQHAHQVVWDRFELRSPESAAKLKPLFFPEGLK
ncbi:MAG: TRAP transporter substrate-binding protein DctP [Gammaproteobacteria bacterium]|jgi:TRAP-type C4-dicarboxylate transport system substrate-binding protein|nr:TRAP transporter substrate-binding protein DctP [Gammaproteobacteria bacterium]MDP6617554.1 TRAP transporter substrate-binding protein DctP [Gammaproteobacteria bacterium]MDP6694431.1 TRAP transporter substrate-binding protein DctP [Gammaproteobacteria bacterium]